MPLFLSLLLKLFSRTNADGFKVAKVETQLVEESRIRPIEQKLAGSLLACAVECQSYKDANPSSKFPTCNTIEYNDATNACSLSYIHKSSKPPGWDASSGGTNSKTVLVQSGAEFSGKLGKFITTFKIIYDLLQFKYTNITIS